MSDTTTADILGPITPIHCTTPGCHWACHGVPDKYTFSRAQILADHITSDHTEQTDDAEQPTAVLRAAAEKLRTLAAAATPSPWRRHTASYPHLVLQGPVNAPPSEANGMISTNLAVNEAADAAYIAVMHPTVGLALADWLERAAVNAAVLTWPNDVVEGALAVARQVLGTTTGQPETEADDTRAAVLKPTEREFLGYALDLAADKMASVDGFTDDDEAALARLRRMADEAQQPAPAPAEETKP